MGKRAGSLPRADSTAHSSGTSSQKAPTAGSPAWRTGSTAASAIQGLRNTPPAPASTGTTWPGRDKSAALDYGGARVATVRAVSTGYPGPAPSRSTVTR
ncbi:hypothetical protein GCM10023080_089270 [Streptomyces pseudoechinosporeus]